MNRMKKSLLAGSLLAVSWGSGWAGAATISGKATLSGAAPARVTIKMAADAVCMKKHAEGGVKDESVVTGPGGALANVFVYVKSGLVGKSFPAPGQAVVFDQNGCWYKPHVFGLQTNQALEIRNSDPTLHNVNFMAKINPPFNLAMPVMGMKITRKYAKPELMIKIKCNVHPWMGAYVGVVDHPFFGVTTPEGRFSLANLPAGKYVIEAWHEKFGTAIQDVTVSEAESKSVQFTFNTK